MNQIIFALIASVACASASALYGNIPSAVYQAPSVHLRPITLPHKAIITGYQKPAALVPASSNPTAAAKAGSADVGLPSGAYTLLAVPSWSPLSTNPIVAEPIHIAYGPSPVYPGSAY